MLIAYFGVVTSEALRRHKLIVLAQPLERTGVFLPLLPVLGFWLASSEVDFSLVLFVVGGLYGLLSILRRSFLFGHVGGSGRECGALVHVRSHCRLPVSPASAVVVNTGCVVGSLAAYLNEDRTD